MSHCRCVCTDPEQVENKIQQFIDNNGHIPYVVVKQEKGFSADDGKTNLSLSISFL